MFTRNQVLLCTLLACLAATSAQAQAPNAEFQKALAQKAAFAETDFAALQLNQPVVRSIPPIKPKLRLPVSLTFAVWPTSFCGRIATV